MALFATCRGAHSDENAHPRAVMRYGLVVESAAQAGRHPADLRRSASGVRPTGKCEERTRLPLNSSLTPVHVSVPRFKCTCTCLIEKLNYSGERKRGRESQKAKRSTAEVATKMISTRRPKCRPSPSSQSWLRPDQLSAAKHFSPC